MKKKGPVQTKFWTFVRKEPHLRLTKTGGRNLGPKPRPAPHPTYPDGPIDDRKAREALEKIWGLEKELGNLRAEASKLRSENERLKAENARIYELHMNKESAEFEEAMEQEGVKRLPPRSK